MFASLSPPLRSLLRAHGVIDRNNDHSDATATSGTDNNGDDDVVVIDDLDDALEWCEEQVGRWVGDTHINIHNLLASLLYTHTHSKFLHRLLLIRFSAASATYEEEEKSSTMTMLTMLLALLVTMTEMTMVMILPASIQRLPDHFLLTLLFKDRAMGTGMV